MNNRENFDELIESYDSTAYDTEAMHTDASNGNFSPERAEEYRHEYIVAESIANGQFAQAREQCKRFGLDYADQLVLNGHTPKG